MSVRSFLVEKFEADWAEIAELADIHVEASQKDVVVNSRVTAVITQTGITRFAQAPMSHRIVQITLTLVSPLADVDDGTDELDPIVSTVLDQLDGDFLPEGAEFALYGERAAYVIPISVISQKVN